MVGGGRSPDEAFQVLVRASQRENRKLRDIAAEIVERAQISQTTQPANPDQIKPYRRVAFAVRAGAG